MNYKGHFSLAQYSSPYTNVKILIQEGNQEILSQEYEFKNSKPYRLTDHLGANVSEYTYLDHDQLSINFYQFEESPADKVLDSRKLIRRENDLEIEETLFNLIDTKEEFVFKGQKQYDDGRLTEEKYSYPDMEYVINHQWNKNFNEEKLIYPNDEGSVIYKYDSEGFLIQYQDYKYQGYCQIIEYQNANGRLSRMTEYPHRAFKKGFLKSGIKFTEETQYIHETHFDYNEEGKKIKERKTDKVNQELISETLYIYEN